MHGRNVSKYLSGGRKAAAYGRQGAGSGGECTPPASQLMAFSPDAVQTLLTARWTCSTPTPPPCPIALEKSSAISSALRWVYRGVNCCQCTFHPIVNFQWCIKVLESSQPLKARPSGPLPPTHSHRHTSLLFFFFFLSWPETQSGAWGETCVVEGGRLDLPSGWAYCSDVGGKKPIHQCSLTTVPTSHPAALQQRKHVWMLSWCSLCGSLHNISTSIGLYPKTQT